MILHWGMCGWQWINLSHMSLSLSLFFSLLLSLKSTETCSEVRIKKKLQTTILLKIFICKFLHFYVFILIQTVIIFFSIPSSFLSNFLSTSKMGLLSPFMSICAIDVYLLNYYIYIYIYKYYTHTHTYIYT